jgi:hypothetical protein
MTINLANWIAEHKIDEVPVASLSAQSTAIIPKISKIFGTRIRTKS